MYQKLQFRRQFILTIAPITLIADWNCLQIDQYYLYAHPDLEVNHMVDSTKSIVLIGSLFDPAEPEKGNDGILKDVHASVSNMESLFSQIKRYAGSYVLFYKDDKHTVMLNDALALREVYYCTKKNQIVCGSQPNIVVKFANPEIRPRSDPEFLEFYSQNTKDLKWNPYRKWIGDETFYEGFKHLLPNHYLDINRREACRYWPNEPIKRLSLEEAVSKSCSFLQGSIRAMLHRHSVMMAVTAGTDSRTLLSASKAVKDKIYYFINNQGSDHNIPDISVSKKIFESIGVPFHVHDVPKHVDEEFRQIFMSNTFFSSERILSTIYNIYFKNHSEKVNILGIGEIGRTRYGKEPKNLNSYRLVYKLGYRDGHYVIRQGEQILAELLPVGKSYDINVLTLFYWEHTLGNWGATGNSESDIAIEELNPYDSHLLYEIFLGVDAKYTKYNKSILFREMISHMWPELLEWPINPTHTMRSKIDWLLRKAGMFELLKELSYQVNYVKYLYKNWL